MKSLRILTALVLLGLGASIAATCASAAVTATITVTNTTTYTMSEFYLSSSDAADWDTTTNLIAGLPILPGQSGTINVSLKNNGDDHGACNYDLMGVLYGAAQFAYQYQVDVCAGPTWTITP